MATAIVPSSVLAAKHLVLLGGSDDLTRANTVFEEQALNLKELERRSGYSSHIFFNGGHKGTEAKLKEHWPNFRDFSKASFNDFINKFENLPISHGDKVLIYVASHGEPKADELSHSVRCGDQLCSLDQLDLLIKKLEAKGAQVALVDSSCYSKPSLNLGTNKTCIITASPQESVGYDQTGNILTKAMGDPSITNLEEAFLVAQSGFYGQPNINSSAGKETRGMLDQFFTIFKNPLPMPFDRVLQFCSFSKDLALSKLQSLSLELSKVTGRLEPEIQALQAAMEKHEQNLTRARNLQEKLEKLDSTEIETENGTIQWSNLTQSNQLIEQDIEKLNNMLMQEKSKVGRQEIQRQLSLYKSFRPLKESLQQSNPLFREYLKESQELKLLLSAGPSYPIGSLMLSQFAVLESERSLYQKIYRKKQEASPCSEFSL